MTDKKDLTPATTDRTPAMVSLVPETDEWGDLDAFDLAPVVAALRIPHVRMNRKSDGGVTFGDGEIVKEFDALLLGRSNSRAQWNKAFKGDTAGPPDCRSFDSLTPDPQSPDRKHDDCATCPFAMWEGRPEDIQDFARCKLSEQWLAFVLDEGWAGGEYLRLRWGGLSASPAAAYWGSFARRLPKTRPFEVVTHVRMVPTETPNGVFLVPEFSRVPGARLTRDQLAPIVADLRRLKEAFEASIQTAVSEHGDEAPDAVRSTDPGQPDDPFATDGAPIDAKANANYMATITGTAVEEEAF